MLNASSSPDSVDGVSQVRAFMQLFRLPVSIVAGLAGVATSVALDPTLPLLQYLLTAIVLVSMSSAACAINDYWDIDKDRIDHSDRPLPSERLTPEQAWWSAIVVFWIALMAAIPLGQSAFILVVVSVLLLWNYSHLLKYSGILGNLIVATIIALLILLGCFAVGQPFAMLYPIGFLFCYAFARELIWDVHDVEGDRALGIATVANLWGVKTAFRWVWRLLILLAVSMPIALIMLPMAHPIWFMVCTTVMLISFAVMLVGYQTAQSERAYERLIFWERIGLLFGVAGLLGTAPAG
jgi:geranylgeranylglycerol-phosphate geranylgeranyltransferase